MTTVFDGTPKLRGLSGDYARVTCIEDRVLLRCVDTMTTAYTPDQARALAAALMEAADKAEGGDA